MLPLAKPAARCTPMVVSQQAAFLWKSIGLPLFPHYKGNAVILIQIVFILANQISFAIEGI